MPKQSETTTKFKVDISELKAGMQEAERSISLATSEFKASTAGMDDWGKSADGLGAKVKQLDSTLTSQKTILSSLEQQHKFVAQEQGENSKGAQDLMIKINNQKAAIGQTESQLRTYNTKLEDVKKASQDVGKETEQTKSALDTLKDTISTQDTELAKLKTAYANLALEQGKDSDEAKNLAREIQNLSTELSQNKSKLSDANYASGELDNSLDDLGDSSEGASGGFTVLKGALADLVAEGISKVIDGFKDLMTSSDEAMTSFQAKTGASTAEVAKFKGEIEDLYKQNFGESMQDVAEAMAEVKQQTGEIDPSKLKDMTKNALGLRTSLGFDVSESIRTVNQLMKNFGITSDEAFNLIVQGTQAGLNQNDNLLDTIGEYAPKFAMTGGSATDMFNQIKNGAESGVFDVDKLGDAMNEFTTKALAGDADDAFVSLGLAVGDSTATIEKAQGEVDKYQQKVTDLKDKLAVAELKQSGFNSKTSEVTKLQMTQSIQKYNEQLADSEGKLSAATLSVESLTSGMDSGKMSVDELKQKFAEGGESAQTAFNDVVNALKTMEDPLQQQQLGTALFGSMWEDTGGRAIMAMTDVSGSMDATKSSMDELNNTSGSTLSSELAGIGRSLKMDLLQPLVDQALPAIKDFANEIKSKLPSIKESFQGVIETVTKLFRFIIDNKDTVIAAIAGVAAGFVAFKIGSFVLTIVKLISSIKSGIGVFAAFNAVLAINPIVLIVAAVAGLVVAFATLWNKSEAFRNFWIGLWDGIKNAFTSVANGIVNFFTVTIPNAFSGAVAAAGNFISGFINFFVTLPARISTLLQAVISAVVTWVSNMVAKAVEAGSQFVNNVIKFITELPYKIGYVLGLVIGNVVKFGVNLIKFATTEIPKFVTNVIKFISQLPIKFATWLTNTITKVVTWGANLISTGKQKASDFINGVISFIQQLPSKFMSWLTKTITNVGNWGKDLVNKGKENATSFVTKVIDFVKQLPEKLANAIKGAIDKVVTWGTNLAAKGAQAATDLFNSVVNGIASLPGKMVEIGGNIVNGVWNGIQNAAGQFAANISNFFSGLVDGAKAALGIHSPSRVFQDEVGVNIVKGVANGVVKTTKTAVSAIGNLCKNIFVKAQSATKNNNYAELGASIVSSMSGAIDNRVDSASTSMQNMINKKIEDANKFVEKQTNLLNKDTENRTEVIKKQKEEIAKYYKEQVNNYKENEAFSEETRRTEIAKLQVREKADKAACDKQIKNIKDINNAKIKALKDEQSNYKEAGKIAMTAYTDSLKSYAQKAKDSVTSILDGITDKFQKNFDDLVKMQDDLTTKMRGYGTLFTTDTTTGTMMVNDIKKQTDTLKAYASNLNSIKGKVSADLFKEISSMSVDEGNQYVKALLSMDGKELQDYVKAYTEKMDLSKSLSENIYKKDFKDLKDKYKSEIEVAMSEATKNLNKIGKQAMNGFVKGMTSQTKNIKSEIKKITDSIINQFKKDLKIHSPSKVFSSMGMFSAVGYLDGFKETMVKLKTSLSDSIQTQNMGIKAPAGSGSSGNTQVVNNFYQTNNSPKSLSRLDIYRQTKNALAFAK